MTGLTFLSFQLYYHYQQEQKTTHYLKTVGSCQQPTTIKIYDETGGIDPSGSAVAYGLGGYSSIPINIFENIHFQNYVNTISQYVFKQVDSMGQCRGHSQQPRVELVFVYRPAISSGIKPFNSKPQKYRDTKYLDSPWVKLTLDKSPQTKIQGVFFWNERQFLLDQAQLVEGKAVSETKPLLPIDIETFDRWDMGFIYAEQYYKAIILKELPVDMLWLFKYQRITDLIDGSRPAMRGLKGIIKGEKRGYVHLSEALIDRFFTSPKTEIYYQNVFDLKDVFNIERYDIDQSVPRLIRQGKSLSSPTKDPYPR